MPDLGKELFRRDLSDAEWQELGHALAREDAASDAVLAEAEAYYRGLGLPDPKLPGQGGSGLLGGASGLITGLVLGALVTAGLMAKLREQAAPPPQPAPASVAPGPALAPAFAPSKPTSIPAPPAPATGGPREASPGFPHLSLRLKLDEGGLVTARVLDAKGNELRVLYAGLLEAGDWRFGWDGLAETGVAVHPGAYVIEIQQGAKKVRKDLVIKGKP